MLAPALERADPQLDGLEVDVDVVGAKRERLGDAVARVHERERESLHLRARIPAHRVEEAGALLEREVFPAAAVDEREVRLGHHSAGIDDAPENGRGERQVESDHPLEQAQIGLGGEVLGQLLAERGGHGLGLVVRETGGLELSREAQGVDRGGGHGSTPSTD